MLKRPFTRVFLTLVLTAAWLLAYPFLYRHSPFLQQHFRTFHYLQQFLTPPPLADSTIRHPDSLLQHPDSLAETTTTPPVAQPRATFVIPALEGDYNGLDHLTSFFAALAGGEEQIRIAYYGDSSIEGDLMCMTFRDSLQRRFGGRGVGFVPITSELHSFRRSVRHSFSNNWARNIIGQPNTYKMLRGISGEYFVAQGAAPPPDSTQQDSILAARDQTHWASYRGSSRFAGTSSFHTARFFYGRPQPDSTTQTYGRLYASVHAQNTAYSLRSPDVVNAIDLSDTTARRISLQFDVSSNYPLYGISLESPTGIFVDNFPCRGNAGRGLKGISRTVLAAFQEYLDYDLIILQYGLNVIDAHLTDYRWYEDQLIDVIHHFQEAMPGVPILVVGVADKATKLNGQMQTDPGVPRVNNVQRAVAQKTGVAFFSLYDAMGGPGSMVRWVQEERPRLANYDYTHFNFTGARVASDLLAAYLLDGYEEFIIQPQAIELD